VGPLGGLHALLRAGGERQVLALACDMPHVSRALLERLLSEQPAAAVLAPRSPSGLWEPLCARYHAARVAPVCAQALQQGQRSFQALLARLEVAELPLSAEELGQLRDWDTPEDVAGDP
jgi:molybdopterin-guanine dinucleotide biosynthesis protein A